ncbi:MAG: arginine--tRNA ligase [Anaerolineales bacterium]|jgi:arginyl-tRNA synthetase|nr:arginine--tRNA ligase [Anaerolineales bacterium]
MMFDAEQAAIDSQVLTWCGQNGLPAPEALQWNPLPFAGEWGISTSFFQLAALEARTAPGSGTRLPVQQRAQEISSQIAANLRLPSGFSRAEASKGYLNLYFNPSEYTRRIVGMVLEQGADFGRGQPKSEKVMVEYAQPNTHHSFHIGHYRNAILGEALARLVEFAGYPTVRASYPGDIGLGVITVLWAYDRFYRGQEPQGVHERGQWLLKIYVEATNLLTPKADETPEETTRREAYEFERREMLRQWDADDPQVHALWQETRQWSLDELDEILAMLGIHIDAWFFESEVDKPSKAIIDDLIARGIAEDDRPNGGPVLVKIDEKLGLKKEKYRTAVVLRNDGTTLYLTKDLALAKVKFDQYGVDRSIYVVDTRQSLHLQQVFKILELMGYAKAAQCHHLGYGFVSLPEGAMSARKGRVVLFKDVADEAVRRVLEVIAEKNPGLPEGQRARVASQVGLGALAYAMLSVDNNKDIIFEMDEALNFDGHTGPYIQNAHVRANSILKKATEIPAESDFAYPLTSHEIDLIDRISRFPAVVEQAAREYRPLLVASYVYHLASNFHSFYHGVPVLQADSAEMRTGRLRLVAAARQTLANAMNLLAIQAPDVM